MNSNVPSPDAKTNKGLTIDAYKDVVKTNKIFTNWRKGKLIQQNELKEKLSIENEAAVLMSNLGNCIFNI